MSDFEILDPVFQRFVLGNAPVERIATGFRWAEGPVWFADANELRWSDIPNNRILRWSEDAGVSTFRAPSNFANGNTRDREGRFVTCEHGTRRVTRTEHDGTITVIADAHAGKRLNSPNDVVVKSDGSIWFTDPHYGIMSDYEGHRSPQEQPCHVYRVDPATGEIAAVLTDFECPNGIAFNPDETRLFVAETASAVDPKAARCIRVFDMDGDTPRDTGVFHTVSPGLADGFRFDTDGNLWTSAGDGVHCLDPAGRILGKIKVPEVVANVCFGGRGRHRLFICGTTSLYSVALNRSGAARP